jgi:hypothetical protein
MIAIDHGKKCGCQQHPHRIEEQRGCEDKRLLDHDKRCAPNQGYKNQQDMSLERSRHDFGSLSKFNMMDGYLGFVNC